ncbi:hypothetical protein AB0L85_21315 [Streptomyces sp. NPDC052051]|uniref:hypothetical protein n=1 Tax=Streptomyces sp. NPDC052051 TaxID=3154649 RepID=UPI00343CC6FF
MALTMALVLWPPVVKGDQVEALAAGRAAGANADHDDGAQHQHRQDADAFDQQKCARGDAGVT